MIGSFGMLRIFIQSLEYALTWIALQVAHPLFDQIFFLDDFHKARLKEEFGKFPSFKKLNKISFLAIKNVNLFVYLLP